MPTPRSSKNVSPAHWQLKYADFLDKDPGNGVVTSDGSGGSPRTHHPRAIINTGSLRRRGLGLDPGLQHILDIRVQAHEAWDRTTDPLIFDIVEPWRVSSHPPLPIHRF